MLKFRELAQRLGLLRKVNNKLTLTKAAARARIDADALWRLVIGGLPLGLTTRGPRLGPAWTRDCCSSSALRSKRRDSDAPGWRDSAGDGSPDDAGAAFARAALRLSGLL